MRYLRCEQDANETCRCYVLSCNESSRAFNNKAEKLAMKTYYALVVRRVMAVSDTWCQSSDAWRQSSDERRQAYDVCDVCDNLHTYICVFSSKIYLVIGCPSLAFAFPLCLRRFQCLWTKKPDEMNVILREHREAACYVTLLFFKRTASRNWRHLVWLAYCGDSYNWCGALKTNLRRTARIPVHLRSRTVGCLNNIIMKQQIMSWKLYLCLPFYW